MSTISSEDQNDFRNRAIRNQSVKSGQRPSQRKKSIFDQESYKIQPVVRTSELDGYGVKLGIKEEDNIIQKYRKFRIKVYIILYMNLILYLGTEAYTIYANYQTTKTITECIPGIIFILFGILVPILTHNLTLRKRKIENLGTSRRGSRDSGSRHGGRTSIKSIISLLSE